MNETRTLGAKLAEHWLQAARSNHRKGGLTQPQEKELTKTNSRYLRNIEKLPIDKIEGVYREFLSALSEASESDQSNLSQLLIDTTSFTPSSKKKMGAYYDFCKQISIFQTKMQKLTPDPTTEMQLGVVKEIVQEAYNGIKVTTPEEKLLLKYITSKEKACVENSYQDSRLEGVTSLITEGQWMDLLRTYGDQEDLSYVFLAAYHQKMISLDELTTAIVFHRAWFNCKDKEHVQVININPEYINDFSGKVTYYNYAVEVKQQQPKWKEVFEKVPNNLKVAIVIDNKSLDLYTLSFISINFHNRSIPGVLASTQATGLLSFGLLKAYYESKVDLIPIFHLTPRYIDIAKRISEDKSDFALFFPKELVAVHGSQDMTIFSQMHDLFHTQSRIHTYELQGDMMLVAESVVEAKSQLASYRNKLSQVPEKLNLVFAEIPTKEEFKSFLVDRVIGELIDGSYEIVRLNGYIVGMPSQAWTIIKLIDKVINVSINDLPRSEDPQQIQMRQELNASETEIKNWLYKFIN